ncbi:MAG: urate hydroxylase PuuD [Pseudomonadota bacterium]|nr:urate hydroxylase PuuD [Pseudomonadota bacterium]
MEIIMLDRWLHIVAGVMWIGLLYYFNFVQVPAMAEATADSDGPGPAAIGKYVAPRALLWFRWAALVTWLTGAYYLYAAPGYSLHGAFTLGVGEVNAQLTSIGIGAWLGTIMLFNVWVLIWPAQKKILGMVEATDEEKASAKRIAFLASRSNTVMSIPMLLFMAATSHHLALFHPG